MVLLTILALILLILAVTVILAVSLGGATFIIVFGDVIVCAVFIVLIIRLIIKRKRHKN